MTAASGPARPTAIFLMGPTAAGKSRVALEIVARYPCDIISVDSALVYRGMDIGTAKPGRNVLTAVPHRLIDIRDPAKCYSAAEFCKDAEAAMAQISAGGRIPLLVGGTMLYFRALESGLAILPSADREVRRRLLDMATACGWPRLHERLGQIDPAAARRIHPNDQQRIMRALEVFEIEGKSWTQLCREPRPAGFPYRVVKLVLAPSRREVLHRRIEQRFDHMLAHGLIEEVAALYRRGDLHLDLPSMKAVGYRQVWNYLDGKSSYDQMRHTAVAATRQFAKRQLTWLRAEGGTRWIDSGVGNPAGDVLSYLASTVN